MTVHSGDVIKVTAVMSGPSGAIMNVYHFHCTTIIDGDDTTVMEDLAQKLDDAYSNIADYLTGHTIFVEVRGFNVTQNAPMPTVTWPTQTVGGSAAADNPAQISFMALFRTGVSRVLGRKFFGGVHGSQIDDNGFWKSTLMTAVGQFVSELLGAFTGTLLNQYVCGVIGKNTGFFYPFLEGLAQAIPAVQRRRRYGRGQ